MKALPIHITDEELDIIQKMSACNFAPSDVAIQLGMDKKSFLELFDDKKSDVFQAYEAGKLSSRYSTMNKQLELADGGNLTAFQIFTKEAEKIEFENLKRKCFFGDE